MCVTINLETGRTFLLTTGSVGPNNTLPPTYWLDGQTYFTIYNKTHSLLSVQRSDQFDKSYTISYQSCKNLLYLRRPISLTQISCQTAEVILRDDHEMKNVKQQKRVHLKANIR